MFIKKIFAAACMMSLPLMADLPQPYISVQTIPQIPNFVLDSWQISSLINQNAAAIIIDVESQNGGVARYIAQQNLPSVAQIYSISLWTSPDKNQKYLYQQFLSNVIQENTADQIVPIRMSSVEAAEGLNLIGDFIYLGSNNTVGLFNDILGWSSHLSSNGIIAGNNWFDRDVETAVTDAAAKLNLVLRVSDNLWYLSKN